MSSGPQPATSSDSPDARLLKARRVRKRRQYVWLQRNGRRCGRGRLVVVRGRPRSDDSRIGITASKRVGNAVVRNRIKRLVREIFRKNRTQIDPPCDVLVIARAEAAHAGYAELAAEMQRALGWKVVR